MTANARPGAQAELSEYLVHHRVESLGHSYRYPVAVHARQDLGVFRQPSSRLKYIGVLSEDAAVAVYHPRIDPNNRLRVQLESDRKRAQ